MRRIVSHPLGLAAVVAVLAAAVVFPNLGAPGLWDDDEGVNAECAREMAEAGTWHVPIFNYELRTAKPILLYWLLRLSYEAFGINEFAARFPSAMAFILTAVLSADLARRMFDAATGLLAGVMTLGCLQLAILGRGCTTDAVLIACTTLYFWAFYLGTANGGRGWFLPCAAASALATLAKGPLVGLALIGVVIGSWFAWQRQLGRLWDYKMVGACLLWGMIAIPWYAFVANETHGEWPKAFFLKENLERGTEAMEAHTGPPFYYLIAVCLMFAPYSAFLAVTAWQTWRNCRAIAGEHTPAYRLLAVWLLVYLAAFSAAATKLPHYIAPAYSPLAILTAAAVARWMRRAVEWPGWAVPGAAVCIALTGVVVGGGLMVAGLGDRFGVSPAFPGLETWAWIGLLPLVGAVLWMVYARRGRRTAAVVAVAITTTVFIALAGAFPPVVLDRFKAVKELVAESGARQTEREVVIAGFEYWQPSLPFYAARPVRKLWNVREVNDLLASPLPLYLFVKENTWNTEPLGAAVTAPYRIAGRQYDFYRRSFVLVVTNR